MVNVDEELSRILDEARARDPSQCEFLQAVSEVLFSLKPLFVTEPSLLRVVPVLIEPDRIIQFKVTWEDDKGDLRVNRGFRVQFNCAIGPYKGGLRFHPSVNVSIL